MEKAFWQGIKTNRFAVPDGVAPSTLIPELLACLADTDPELRDGMAYEIFAVWLRRGVFSDTDAARIAAECMAGLRVGLGEQETDSVFRRTFSALILGEVVARDAKDPALGEDGVRAILDSALAYLEAEQDLRAVVPGKGWAHGVAHAGDVLRALAGHPQMGAAELKRMLEAIGARVAAGTTYPFIANEEDRLGLAVVKALRRDLLEEAWLRSWAAGLAGQGREWQGKEDVRCHNAKSLVMSLFVLLSCADPAPPFRDPLLAELRGTLKAFAPWF